MMPCIVKDLDQERIGYQVFACGWDEKLVDQEVVRHFGLRFEHNLKTHRFRDLVNTV